VRGEIITSAGNPLLKAIKRAARRGETTPGGFIVAESPHLLREARASGVEIGAIVVDEAASAERKDEAGEAARSVSSDLFAELSSTEKSQGVITLARLPHHEPSAIFDREGLVVILDAVQDPGNVGTIVRTAEAFGAAGVILGSGTARAANPKTIRASAGSLFRLPVVSLSPAQVIGESLRADRRLLVASASSGAPVADFLSRKDAIVIGSEAHGVRSEYIDAAQQLHIPIQGAESLNAAIAAAVIVYEAQRNT